MKKMSKTSFFDTVCVFFTILAISKIVMEYIVSKQMDDTGRNLLFMFAFTCLSLFVLDQYSRFENLSPLIIIIGQYIVAMGIVFFIIWISSHFEQLSTNAYRDIFLSFTIPYIIGAICYYVSLHLEVKRENEMLDRIKKSRVHN